MDFSSEIQSSEALVLLLLFYILTKICSKQNNNTKQITVPEPSGALPLIGHLHLLRGQTPIAMTLGSIADKYGPIYSLRLGIHRAVVVNTWEFAKEFLTTHDKVFATRPNIAAGKYMGYGNAIFALSPYGQYWRDVRKLVTLELLSNTRLELLNRFLFAELDFFVKDLYFRSTKNDEADYPLDMPISKVFGNLTFNIALGIMVGKRFSAAEYVDEKSDGWCLKNGIERMTYLSGVFVPSDALPWVEWMDFNGYVRDMKQTSEEIDCVIGNWLEEHHWNRRVCGSDSDGDFMDVMLSNIAENANMSGYERDTVIKATTLTLILTATGSTAITLTWALSLLVNNPNVLKAAQEELDKFVGRDKWVEESDINNLNYLQAIIKETLRLYPPAPLTGVREAMEDCHIGKFYIPKGARLLINIWKLHRDPRVWSNPCEFQPERFLTTHSKIDSKGQHFELIPFSSGRRGCPGYSFGMQVVHLTLARLLQAFHIEKMTDAPVDMQEGLGVALPKVNPLEVMLTPRLPPALYNSL